MTIRAQPALCGAAVVCFPLLLLAVNDSWVFVRPGGWRDPFFYTGYFLDLRQHLNVFQGTYYGTRLPWILLGAAVHAVASFEVAEYALRLILFYAATFSLFAIVRMLFRNDVAATIAAFALGAHAYFLWAIGWDYVDGSGVTLILVTTACLTAAATGRRWRVWLFCAGAACVCMTVGYVVLILIVPFLTGAYIFMNAFHRRNPLAVSAACAGSGGAVAIGVLGAINWTLTGLFLFFLPQLRMALTISADRAEWKAPNYNWVANATWLVFPAVALTVGVVIVASVLYNRLKGGVTSNAHRHAVLFVALLAGVETTYLLMELKGYWLLQLPFYASYLIPFVFICIGAAIALATAQVSGRRGAWLIGAATVVLILPFVAASVRSWAVVELGFGADFGTVPLVGRVGVLAVAGALFLAAAAVFKNAWLTLPALLALGLVNVDAAPRTVFEFPRSSTSVARVLMIPDAQTAIRPFNQDGNLRFWYDVKEPLGGVFRAVASANLFAYRLVTEDFPGHSPVTPGMELHLGDTIAVLTSSHDVLPRAARSLSELGLRPETLGQERVTRGTEAFNLTFVRLMPMDVGGASELDLSAMNLTPGSQLKNGHGGLTVRTAATPWAYAAQLPIPKELRDEFGGCGIAFKMHVQVAHATVGLGVLSADGTKFLARRPVLPTSGATDVLLGVPRLSDAGDILIQSWESPAKEGTVDVDSITLIRHHCMPMDVEVGSELDLSAMDLTPWAQLKNGHGGLTVRTAATPWAYAAQLPIPKALRDEFGGCSVAFRIHVQVTHSTIGLGVLNSDGTNFLARKPVPPAAGATDVLLDVPGLSDAGDIVIQAWEKPAGEATVDVNSITLIRRHCPAGK